MQTKRCCSSVLEDEILNGSTLCISICFDLLFIKPHSVQGLKGPYSVSVTAVRDRWELCDTWTPYTGSISFKHLCFFVLNSSCLHSECVMCLCICTWCCERIMWSAARHTSAAVENTAVGLVIETASVMRTLSARFLYMIYIFIFMQLNWPM